MCCIFGGLDSLWAVRANSLPIFVFVDGVRTRIPPARGMHAHLFSYHMCPSETPLVPGAHSILNWIPIGMNISHRPPVRVVFGNAHDVRLKYRIVSKGVLLSRSVMISHKSGHASDLHGQGRVSRPFVLRVGVFLQGSLHWDHLTPF